MVNTKNKAAETSQEAPEEAHERDEYKVTFHSDDSDADVFEHIHSLLEARPSLLDEQGKEASEILFEFAKSTAKFDLGTGALFEVLAGWVANLEEVVAYLLVDDSDDSDEEQAEGES